MLVYLLKFSACLAIFMLFYKLFLEKENMHQLKRYYLLVSTIIAMSIPLITFTTYVERVVLNVDFQVDPEIFNRQEIVEAQINYVSIILWSLYSLGVFLFLTKFILNLSKIVFKIKRNPKHKTPYFTHVLLNDLITPHTFFRYIFLNKDQFETQQIPKEVLIHEQAHAKQKHSIDILFIEFLQIVFWCNPFIYLIKQSIKMNHEFLADDAVLKQGVAPSTYQQLLLTFTSNVTETELANAINYPSIKKRFKVMKTHTSKRKIWLRSLLFLPLVSLTLYGFSQTKEVVKEVTSKLEIESIDFFLNEKGEFLLNEKVISLKEIAEMYRQNNDLSISIKAYPDVDSKLASTIFSEIKKIGFNKMTFCTSGDTINPKIKDLLNNFQVKNTDTSNKPANVNRQSKTKEMVMLNGVKSTDLGYKLTKEELRNIELTIEKGSIVAFYFKIPGKPTVFIKGNVLNDKAKSLIKELLSGDSLQLFMIKNSDNAEHPPIFIQMQ